jgi:alkanesulfonate monooxygenase SsuD/methylene tetrahydromethanopterin reductase-like flavin-dependent oxidoreductase (luciferase family)
MLGGPKACRVAASPLFDGVYLQPFMTIDAVSNSVGWIRDECERIGRDFAAIRIVAPLVSAPELPDERARAYMHARMVTYLAQPGMMDVYAKLNGWDPKRAEPVRNHELFQHDRDRVDHHFHREDLMEVAKLVPDEWVYETSLAGPIKACVDKMRAYKDAGADEICFYGSTPAENSGLIRAWREHTTAPEAVAGPQVARR